LRRPGLYLDIVANVDGHRHAAIFAIHDARAIGAARYVRDPDAAAEAEIAATVTERPGGARGMPAPGTRSREPPPTRPGAVGVLESRRRLRRNGQRNAGRSRVWTRPGTS
jgi:hypothetical protein